jgi:hypothetical protein
LLNPLAWWRGIALLRFESETLIDFGAYLLFGFARNRRLLSLRSSESLMETWQMPTIRSMSREIYIGKVSEDSKRAKDRAKG